MKRLLLGLTILLLSPMCSAVDYHVGVGQPYVTIGAVGFKALNPGDRVLIHAPGVFHEKFTITRNGTTIIGIPDANGALPIIDGANATTNTQFDNTFRKIEDYGLITIWDHNRWPGNVSDVSISNLELRNAFRVSDTTPSTYTAFDGTVRQWDWLASAIYALACDHLTIKNCWIHDNSQGIFVSGSRDNSEVNVDGCRIWGNSNLGITGVFLTHNVYVECRGFSFTNNWCGPTRLGSLGGNIKCRDAGDIIVNNYIEGGQRLLDLVEGQSNYAAINADPRFSHDTVDHNTLVTGNGQSISFCHYGYEWIPTPTSPQRIGLTFTNNVCVSKKDFSSFNYTEIFDLTTNKQVVNASGNCFVAIPNGSAKPSGLVWELATGVTNLGANVAWPVALLDTNPTRPLTGSINGKANVKIANPILDANLIPSLSGPSGGAGWNGGTGSVPLPIPTPTPVPVPTPTPIPIIANAVTISPPIINLQPGQTQPFTATDAAGNPVTVTWSATGGVIDPKTGFFVAGPNAGAYSVTAVATSTAQVTITVPVTLASIQVTPTNATVPINGTVQFTATGTGSDGKPFQLGAISWLATNGATISGMGLFTAQNVAGPSLVTASFSQIQSAPVTVSVTPPPFTGRFLKPGPTSTINPVHSLSAGLAVLLPLNEGAGNALKDLVSANSGVAGTIPFRWLQEVVDFTGPIVDWTGATGVGIPASNPIFKNPPTTGYSYALLFKPTSATYFAPTRIMDTDTSSAFTSYPQSTAPNKVNIGYRDAANVGRGLNFTIPVNPLSWITMVVTVSTTTITVYANVNVDGTAGNTMRVVASAPCSLPNTWGALTTRPTTFYLAGTGTTFVPHVLAAGEWIWAERCLSLMEIQGFYADPFGMMK